MLLKNKQNNGSRITTSPLIIFGSTLILLVILVVLAIQNYNHEKQYMVKTLNEKGVALIKAVEAGARTGMMGMGKAASTGISSGNRSIARCFFYCSRRARWAGFSAQQ